MINGHESLTEELNEEERMLANRLISAFSKRSKNNPVTATEIVSGVNKNMKLTQKFSDRRLRKIINHYRVNAILPIISTSKGYYVSYDENEIEGMIISLTQRANSILEGCFGMQRILNEINNK
ncbi:MAG: hypothetical protein ACOVK2_01235 [Candidatus Fonsibacter sp.]